MLLEYKNIFKTFGGNQVLKGISFSAESGEALGILGRNGAGKTTLLRILLNVFPADSGEILVDGRAIPQIVNDFLLLLNRWECNLGLCYRIKADVCLCICLNVLLDLFKEGSGFQVIKQKFSIKQA